ncbi:MAG: cation transporter [Hyphomicrobiaceae bacterium]
MSPSGSSNFILVAFLLNAAIAAAKLFATAMTGSGAVRAEFIHSIAVATSLALLVVSVRRAGPSISRTHPDDAANELRFWAIVVPILLYSLGAGVALNEGTAWLQAPLTLTDLPNGLLILGLLLILQIALAVIAWRRSEGADPGASDAALYTLTVESIAAVAGLGATVGGLGAAYIFGSRETDALAAVTIGLIMGAVAALMALEARKLLVRTATRSPQQAGELPVSNPGDRRLVEESESPPAAQHIVSAPTHRAYPPPKHGKGKKKRR